MPKILKERKLKTKTEKTIFSICRFKSIKCIQLEENEEKYEFCFKNNFDCLKYKPSLMENEIKRLNIVVKNHESRIQNFEERVQSLEKDNTVVKNNLLQQKLLLNQLDFLLSSIDSKQHPKKLIDNIRFVLHDLKQLFEYSFRQIYFEFYHINEVTTLSKLSLKYIKRYEEYFDPTVKMINFFKQKECKELFFYESIILNTIIDCNDSIATIFTDLFIKIGIFKIFSFGVDFILSKECNCSGSD
ncbi:2907_t:CDS:2, partial [Scutellospora calospora]